MNMQCLCYGYLCFILSLKILYSQDIYRVSTIHPLDPNYYLPGYIDTNGISEETQISKKSFGKFRYKPRVRVGNASFIRFGRSLAEKLLLWSKNRKRLQDNYKPDTFLRFG